MATFPIRFSRPNRLMVMVGISPTRCRVDVGDGRLRVRFAWGFRLDAALDSVRSAEPDHGRVRGWGVHGWRGRWLVNGSSDRIVRLTFDPPARARTLGVPISLRELRVSVEDPEGLVRALRGSSLQPELRERW